MSARRSVGAGLALLLLALAACDRRTTTPAPAPGGDSAAESSAPPSLAGSSAAAPTASAAMPDGEARAAARDECGPRVAKITRAKSIGHTSVVYKIELEGGGTYAWKVNATKVKDRWRGEVAAYRLGRALGIPNVPLACPRSFPRDEVLALLGRPAFDELIASPGDAIEGALIPWIPSLSFLALEKDPLRSEARAWLRDRAKPVPAEKSELAAQISTLVVFDAVAGHWDRYSGGNVGLDATGKQVLFIDNDSTFMSQPPAERMRENMDALARTERFSRSLYSALRALDGDAPLRAALGHGLDGEPLLLPPVVTLVRERLSAVLATIAKKIAERSEADVLVFP
ncbi:MAG: hypothetical protein KIT84_28095 [Labilithrix sp.]|nr:hypothetical protein [Labilithrix sp.]MCW5814920.1 hypothetical protein [Labilithrix sp.]